MLSVSLCGATFRKAGERKFFDICRNGDEKSLMKAAGAFRGSAEIVDVLIEAGAYVNARDKNGKKAVDYARNNPKLKGTSALKRLEKLSR